jgi:MarR family transcriptional regulator for hemolysin
MLRHDFETSIGHWLVLTAKEYERAANAAIVPSGITWRQAQVLGWLAFEEALTQADLADRMSIEAPTLVGILDRMERDGWICRHDCLTDRRKKIIRATPQAEPVWETVLACVQGVRAVATRGFSDQERMTLIDMLARVRRNLLEGGEAESCDALAAVVAQDVTGEVAEHTTAK